MDNAEMKHSVSDFEFFITFNELKLIVQIITIFL